MSCQTLTRLLCLGSVALAGCSSFQEDFNDIASRPAPPGQIEGAWVGTWRSDASGHSGDLKAIVVRVGRDEYLVRYRAEYDMLWTMSFEHETTIRGHFSGSTFHFEGDADLGWPYGVYDYAGYATAQEFFSTYKSENDHGVYELRRPTVQAASAGDAEREVRTFELLAVEALSTEAQPDGAHSASQAPPPPQR